MKKKLLSVLLGVMTIILSTILCYAFDAVQNGDNNTTVKEIQEILIDLGYLSGSADGTFQEDTLSADANIGFSENDLLERDFDNIIARIGQLCGTLQISEKISKDGAEGVAVLLNDSRFNLLYNENNDGIAVGIMPVEINGEAGAQDLFVLYPYLIQSVDTSLSTIEAIECLMTVYNNDEYEKNGVSYHYLPDSYSLMINYS